MKQASNRGGVVAGLVTLASVVMGCAGTVVGESDLELGEPCVHDDDCLTGICDDVSGDGAICLQDIEGDVVATCLNDEAVIDCQDDPFAELRYVRRIDGSLQVGFLVEPLAVVLPNLREVTGNVMIGEINAAADIELDGLVSVGGHMEIGFAGAERVSLASLERVGVSLTLSAMTRATSISMPSLETVGSGGESAFSLWLLPSLVELEVPSLERVDGDLMVTDVPQMTDALVAELDAVEVTGIREMQP